jgi:hypothetical protein
MLLYSLMDFNQDDYVSEAEARLRYPNGAEVAFCRFCARMLVIETGTAPDCACHPERSGEGAQSKDPLASPVSS